MAFRKLSSKLTENDDSIPLNIKNLTHDINNQLALVKYEDKRKSDLESDSNDANFIIYESNSSLSENVNNNHSKSDSCLSNQNQNNRNIKSNKKSSLDKNQINSAISSIKIIRKKKITDQFFILSLIQYICNLQNVRNPQLADLQLQGKLIFIKKNMRVFYIFVVFKIALFTITLKIIF